MPQNDYQDTKNYIPPILKDPTIPDEQRAHLPKFNIDIYTKDV